MAGLGPVSARQVCWPVGSTAMESEGVADGPRRRGRLATGGCIFGCPRASWLRGHGAFVFPGRGAPSSLGAAPFPVDLMPGLQGEGATHGARFPRLLIGRALGQGAGYRHFSRSPVGLVAWGARGRGVNRLGVQGFGGGTL